MRDNGTTALACRSTAPPSSGTCGVVLLHDWWGPSATWRRLADELAAQGYRTLVPDLYDGYRPATPIDAMRRLMDLDVNMAVDVVRATAEQLGGPVALVGFSLGGRVAMLAAERGVPCQTVISFYGAARKGEVPASTSMPAPLQLHLCRNDQFFRPGRQQRLADALTSSTAAGKRPAHEVHWYDAAHGFFDSARADLYDAEAAAQSWSRALAFLKMHLSSGAAARSR